MMRFGVLVQLWILFIHRVSGQCHFNAEYLGEYHVQASSTYNAIDGRHYVTYSSISIFPDSIPVWGQCHERFGHNFILKDKNDCFRCIRMERSSDRILRLSASDWDKCFTREDFAMLSCPKYLDSQNSEIILIRLKDGNGSSDFPPSFCPLDGQYQFSYIDWSVQCDSGLLNNCPRGDELTLSNCDSQLDSSWQCLGNWKTGDSTYFIFRNRNAVETEPHYRCAVLTQRADGEIQMMLSGDGTCPSESYSSERRRFRLRKTPMGPLPPLVRKSSCLFPERYLGQWENLIVQKQEIIHKNHKTLQTETSVCVRSSPKNPDRFLVHTRSPCGRESYNCLWIQSRSRNVLEFQIGLRPSTTPSIRLCDNDHFLKRTWSTEAKQGGKVISSCPVSGKYTGRLPDAPNLCAKLASDCENPEIMFYSVSDCYDNKIIYEERQYQCLGQWIEDDGLIFTYTQRRDLGTFECFVGKIVSDGGLFLIEGGSSCRRGLSVVKYGMKLKKIDGCFSNDNYVDKPWYTSMGYVDPKVENKSSWHKRERRETNITDTPTIPFPRFRFVSNKNETEGRNDRSHLQKEMHKNNNRYYKYDKEDEDEEDEDDKESKRDEFDALEDLDVLDDMNEYEDDKDDHDHHHHYKEDNRGYVRGRTISQQIMANFTYSNKKTHKSGSRFNWRQKSKRLSWQDFHNSGVGIKSYMATTLLISMSSLI